MEAIKKSAAELAAHFGSTDPFSICENLDISVLRVELPPNIRGFYTSILGVQIIYLNSDLKNEQEQRAVCAHELGHAVLHASQNTMYLKMKTNFVTARYEREADLFAGYLLLDHQTVEDCWCNGWTAGQVAKITALPEQVVSYCLKN